MKRFALALAAASLGIGCSAPPCNPTASIDWSYQGGAGGFRDSTNAIRQTCSAAGVTVVEVWVNGGLAGGFDCFAAPPATIPLLSGANDVTVEGLNAPSASGGVILFRDQLAIDATSCGFQGTYVAQPAEGLVNVSYAFTPNNLCYSPSSYVWIRVWDNIAGVWAADSSSAPTSNDACVVPSGPTNPLSFSLAAGDYTLVATEEMIWNGASWIEVGKDCTHYDVPVAGGAPTTTSPLLVDDPANVRCP
jgi:hypothetical protein